MECGRKIYAGHQFLKIVNLKFFETYVLSWIEITVKIRKTHWRHHDFIYCFVFYRHLNNKCAAKRAYAENAKWDWLNGVHFVFLLLQAWLGICMNECVTFERARVWKMTPCSHLNVVLWFWRSMNLYTDHKTTSTRSFVDLNLNPFIECGITRTNSNDSHKCLICVPCAVRTMFGNKNGFWQGNRISKFRFHGQHWSFPFSFIPLWCWNIQTTFTPLIDVSLQSICFSKSMQICISMVYDSISTFGSVSNAKFTGVRSVLCTAGEICRWERERVRLRLGQKRK